MAEIAADLRINAVSPLKWVSLKDTLLGTFTMPYERTHALLTQPRWQELRFMVLNLRCAFSSLNYSDDMSHLTATHKTVTIRPAGGLEHRDGYNIFGITPEEWEKIPGHTFAPSAGYIRSLLEERG